MRKRAEGLSVAEAAALEGCHDILDRLGIESYVPQETRTIQALEWRLERIPSADIAEATKPPTVEELEGALRTALLSMITNATESYEDPVATLTAAAALLREMK